MKQFRYNTKGNWYKGGTHAHSTHSDGGLSVEQLGTMYAGAGFDFLFLTDHWVCSHAAERPAGDPLVWMDGVELDGKTAAGRPYHIVCLGTFTGITCEMTLEQAAAQARHEGGFLILAHPHWMGNIQEDASAPQIAGLEGGFDGVEVYNHVCRWLNGKGDGLIFWTGMLDSGCSTLAIASDDVHYKDADNGWNGGWIMVNAPECTQPAVLQAIRKGNFYASTGPGFKSIRREWNELVLETTPVQFIRLVGPAYHATPLGSYSAPLMTSARIKLPDDWLYSYVEIEDSHGKRAWSNTLFIDDGR